MYKSIHKMGKRLLLCMLCCIVFTLCGCGGGTNSAGQTDATDAPDKVTVEDTLPDELPVETTQPAPSEMSSTEIASYAGERTVTVHAKNDNGGTSDGTGFYIDDQGTIVTCYHVIDGARELSVEVAGGGTYTVQKILDLDVLHDIAILKIGMTGNPYFEFGEAVIGEDVRAVGSSLGTLTGTVSQGIVSQFDTVGAIDCVQTDAAISSGNSGGPLLNMYGEVIGVNAYSYARGQNLNLAVNIDYVKEMAMDKDWSMSDFKEWYDVQTARSYQIYSYTHSAMLPSMINTYGEVTGAECLLSSWDYDFEDVVEGFDRDYCVFIYEYSSGELEEYRNYLKSNGFEYMGHAADDEEMVFYWDSFNDYLCTVMVPSDESFVLIEVTHGEEFEVE